MQAKAAKQKSEIELLKQMAGKVAQLEAQVAAKDRELVAAAAELETYRGKEMYSYLAEHFEDRDRARQKLENQG